MKKHISFIFFTCISVITFAQLDAYNPQNKRKNPLISKQDLHPVHSSLRQFKSKNNSQSVYKTTSNKQKLDSIVDDYDGYKYKIFYYYDANGHDTLSLSYELDATNNKWEQYDKLQQTYYSNGKMAQIKFSLWNNNQWENKYKTEYTYSASLLSIVISRYSNNQWDNVSKQDHTFDGNGNVLSEIYYYWGSNTSQWKQNEKSEFTYDNNNNAVSIIKSSFDLTQWIKIEKQELNYINNNKVKSMIDFSWDFSKSEWIYSYKDTLIYDANYNASLLISLSWDTLNSQWNNSYKDTSTYDTNGNIIRHIEQLWFDNKWANEFKIDLTYDNTVLFGDLIIPYELENLLGDYDFYYFNPYSPFSTNEKNKFTYYSWDNTSNSWIAEGNTMFYYSGNTGNGIKEISQQYDFSIFPNPSNGVVNLVIDNKALHYQVEVSNLLGELVYTNTLTENNRQINLSDLPKGMYTISVKTEQTSSTKRIIIGND